MRYITNYAAYALFVHHIIQNTDTNPYAKFPQVFHSHRCSIPTGAEFPKVVHLGLGAGGWGAGGLGGWVLLGPMGLVVVQMAPQLYGLVRKPLATLHRAAGEPLRQAPNNFHFFYSIGRGGRFSF